MIIEILKFPFKKHPCTVCIIQSTCGNGSERCDKYHDFAAYIKEIRLKYDNLNKLQQLILIPLFIISMCFNYPIKEIIQEVVDHLVEKYFKK